MSSNVPVAQATSEEVVLPERVQRALGQLVGAAKGFETEIHGIHIERVGAYRIPCIATPRLACRDRGGVSS